jgi:hypothetical protein
VETARPTGPEVGGTGPRCACALRRTVAQARGCHRPWLESWDTAVSIERWAHHVRRGASRGGTMRAPGLLSAKTWRTRSYELPRRYYLLGGIPVGFRRSRHVAPVSVGWPRYPWSAPDRRQVRTLVHGTTSALPINVSPTRRIHGRPGGVLAEMNATAGCCSQMESGDRRRGSDRTRGRTSLLPQISPVQGLCGDATQCHPHLRRVA